MLSHAHDQPTAEKLVEWMKEKAIFISEYGSGSGGAHVVDADAGFEPPPPVPEGPGWTRRRHEEEEEEELSEEQVSAMRDSELLAIVRSGGSFKGGKGWRRKVERRFSRDLPKGWR